MKKILPYTKLLAGAWIVYYLISEFDIIRTEINFVLAMWSQTLIPSLFPYLVLSRYLTSSGAFEVLTPFLGFLGKVFSISSHGVGVYICSLVCGYPSGAVCIAGLYNEGLVSRHEAQRLVCFTNNAGPLFLISAVGGCMLGSVRDGVIIYVVQCVSAFLVGVMLSFVSKKRAASARKGQKEHVFSRGSYSKMSSSPKSIGECSQSAVSTMLMIGAYTVVASVVGRIVVQSFGSFFEGDSFIFESFVYSVLEISAAMTRLCLLEKSPLTFGVICACASWAGVSVMMQIKSVLPKELGIKPVVISKLVQSILSFALGFGVRSRFVDVGVDFAAFGTVWKISAIVCLLLFSAGVFHKPLSRKTL